LGWIFKTMGLGHQVLKYFLALTGLGFSSTWVLSCRLHIIPSVSPWHWLHA
jgi:hypothetical protein